MADLVFFTDRDNPMVSVLRSLTPRGYTWIRDNMDHDESFLVRIQKEFVDELKQLITKDGLHIKERE